MAPVVLDTNVVLRFLLADDLQLHTGACAIFDTIISGQRKGFLCEGIIAECVYVLDSFYQVPRRRIFEYLFGIIKMRGATGPQIGILDMALHLFRDHTISFPDALVLATSRTLNLELATFDQKLARLAVRLDESQQD